jgi:hypothetical protein
MVLGRFLGLRLLASSFVQRDGAGVIPVRRVPTCGETDHRLPPAFLGKGQRLGVTSLMVGREPSASRFLSKRRRSYKRFLPFRASLRQSGQRLRIRPSSPRTTTQP